PRPRDRRQGEGPRHDLREAAGAPARDLGATRVRHRGGHRQHGAIPRHTRGPPRFRTGARGRRRPAAARMSADKIAVVGAGLIGRAWAIVFARAGHAVALHDADRAALADNLPVIDAALRDLRNAGLLEEAPSAVRARIRVAGTLDDALDGAAYVQENIRETLEAKRDIFRRMDTVALPETILASSTSTIPASEITRDLAGRRRCLVAHPVNPPHLVPLVELAPAPWTSPD